MVLNDARIQALIAEPKPTVEPAALMPTTIKGRHRERQESVRGGDGSGFRLIVRQAMLDLSDFSVILGYEVAETTGLFRLRRHNGDSHEHSNRLAGSISSVISRACRDRALPTRRLWGGWLCRGDECLR